MNAQEITTDVVKRTYNTADNFGMGDVPHGLIGLVGEVGEIADTVKRHLYYGQPLDRENIVEEIGDLFFYLIVLCVCFQVDLTDAAIQNRDKLQKRFPDGFTEAHAALRLDKK